MACTHKPAISPVVKHRKLWLISIYIVDGGDPVLWNAPDVDAFIQSLLEINAVLLLQYTFRLVVLEICLVVVFMLGDKKSASENFFGALGKEIKI